MNNLEKDLLATPQRPYIYPTDRQIVRALANAIATHRDVTNAKIYFPFIEGDRNVATLVPLQAVRTFAGTEYIQDGLTLAVYLPSREMGLGRAITYKDMHLGRPVEASNNTVSAEVKVVVHLYYREPSYNAPAVINSQRSNDLNEITKLLPYGNYLQYEESLPNADLGAIGLNQQLPPTHYIDNQTLNINILPGEEILRDWMALLRGVVRDLPQLKPFAVRDPTIQFVEYETPNWESNNNRNLVFHAAYMLVCYSLYEPSRASDYEFATPHINVQANKISNPYTATTPQINEAVDSTYTQAELFI